MTAQDFVIGSLTVERDGYKRLAERRSADIVRLIEEIKRLTFERDAALRLLAGKEPEPEVNPVFAAIAIHQAQGVR